MADENITAGIVDVLVQLCPQKELKGVAEDILNKSKGFIAFTVNPWPQLMIANSGFQKHYIDASSRKQKGFIDSNLHKVFKRKAYKNQYYCYTYEFCKNG